MILIDTNVLMYAVGSEHPNKAAALQVITKVASGEERAAINAETLQEILHRFRSLDRWAKGLEVYDLARGIFDDILAITVEVIDRAREIADVNSRLAARDAVHAAVVEVYGLNGIVSFDDDFESVPGLTRLSPTSLFS